MTNAISMAIQWKWWPKYVFLSIIVLTMLIIGHRDLIAEPQAAVKECNSKALEFLQEQEDRLRSYPNELRDEDYDFFYRACMRARGYEI